ncbi:Ribonuclease J OS=Cellulomonas persica OX=76861 GN=rnj PE=3 SV=1 [Cellulomonas persica]
MSHPHPELDTPPPLAEGALRVVALGGLGEVGRNMAVLEFAGRLLVVDCGVLFPEDHQPGVDLILPDFDYIRDRLGDIEAIVLTHGHEDHIGAVPYLLRLREDIPLVGSQLTLAFVEAKLKEHRITPVTRPVREGQVERFGQFECEFVAVNHSIPDALAVAVTTPAGTVLHTGDFKMDQLPLDGRITDLRAFARLGEKGVDLFMVDSTNAEVPGFVAPERGIGPVLDSVFADSAKRIIVASFASHVHRVQQVLDAAAAHGRRVALVGRSMVRNMAIAADLGYLKVPDGVLVDLKAVGDLPDDEVVLMCTGSQGEPMAALSRMANNDHKVSVGAGDTVILASSLIPGNENAVYRVINGLTRLGARVVHSGNAKVHVSGHASAGELLYCYNILRPRNVMPVHGEVRHLVANAALAVQTGVPADRVVLAEDGVVVDLVDGRASVVGAVPCGYVYVDGSSVGGITEAELKDRRILGDEGFVSIFAVVSSADGKVLAGPQIHARGFAEQDEVFEDILPEVTRALRGGRRARCDRHPPAPAGHPARRRPVGLEPAAPPADDHPRGGRGLTENISRWRRGVVRRCSAKCARSVAADPRPARRATSSMPRSVVSSSVRARARRCCTSH